MDPHRFDELTRLVASSSRRQMIKTLVGIGGGGLLALVGARAAGAEPLPIGNRRAGCEGKDCGECGDCIFGRCFPSSFNCGPDQFCHPRTLTCRSGRPVPSTSPKRPPDRPRRPPRDRREESPPGEGQPPAGDCASRSDGAPCGGCGFCSSGTCVPGTCPDGGTCHPETLECVSD